MTGVRKHFGGFGETLDTANSSTRRFVRQTAAMTMPHKEYLFQAGSTAFSKTTSFSPREVRFADNFVGLGMIGMSLRGSGGE